MPETCSVVIPAYNSERTIERSLRSVLEQTRPVSEIIVVDDASTDGTRDVVRRLAKSDDRLKLLENASNRGPSGSRNRGFAAATGTWIAIQDADDAWRPNRVELMLDAAARDEVDFVADNMLLHDVGTDQITRIGFPIERGLRWIRPIDVFEQVTQLGAEFSYGLLQPIIRREFLESNHIRYNEDVRFGEDLLFLAEIMLSGARAVIIPDPLYIYTTPVGDHSKAASPHSKTIKRFDLFAAGIETVRSQYRASISKDIDRAMTRLTRRLRLIHGAGLAREQRLTRGLFAYALYIGQRPPVLGQVIRQRAAHLKHLLSASLNSPGAAPDLSQFTSAVTPSPALARAGEE
jgi:succinoglycan biosynthesis protein ExoO